ncbi:MAG: MFS transporter, partial [Lautropia sp.]
MAILDQAALNDGVRGREVLAWAGYDFANSGYTTVVLTAVFNAYFVGVVAGAASWATFAWTAALAVSNLAVMLTMPAIGARADRHASKKRWLGLATVACVAATAGLAGVGRGDLALALLLIVVSNYFYSMGEAISGAFLPELARPAAFGRVSGWGWAFGYLGGMLALGLSLVWVLTAQARGEGAEQFVPVTMLITAAVYLIAAAPVFPVLRERARPVVVASGTSGDAAVTSTSAVAGAPAVAGSAAVTGGTAATGWLGSLAALRDSARRTAAFPDFRRLLATGAAYQAGIAVVIALAAVYADQVIGFKPHETMLLIFVVNIAAAAGAFLFGYYEDRIGHRRALAVTLLAWIAMIVVAVASTSRPAFWVAATL